MAVNFHGLGSADLTPSKENAPGTHWPGLGLGPSHFEKRKLLVSSGKRTKIHLLPTHSNLDTIKKIQFKM